MMMTCQDAISSVSVMRMKEETDYRCEDYIANFSQSHGIASNAVVDEACRKLMADWCLKVVDRCSFARDTAAIAMNMLDRYLATETGASALVNRDIFQLASMTTLYTAIKIHEAEALQPETIVQLSRGIFSVKDIEQMEIGILFAIQWRTNPPTALTFVQHFLEAAPSSLTTEDKRTLFKLAKLQTEMTITDYSFVCKNASSIAYAALANAMELLQLTSNFMKVLSNLASIDEAKVLEIKEDLKQRVQQEDIVVASYFQNNGVRPFPQDTTVKSTAQSAHHTSPREVRSFNQ